MKHLVDISQKSTYRRINIGASFCSYIETAIAVNSVNVVLERALNLKNFYGHCTYGDISTRHCQTWFEYIA